MGWQSSQQKMIAFVHVIVFLECTVADSIGTMIKFIATTIVLGSFLEKLHVIDMFFGGTIVAFEVFRSSWKTEDYKYLTSMDSIKVKNVFLKKNLRYHVHLCLLGIMVTCLLLFILPDSVEGKPNKLGFIWILILIFSSMIQFLYFLELIKTYPLIKIVPLMLLPGVFVLLRQKTSDSLLICTLFIGPILISYLLLLSSGQFPSALARQADWLAAVVHWMAAVVHWLAGGLHWLAHLPSHFAHWLTAVPCPNWIPKILCPQWNNVVLCSSISQLINIILSCSISQWIYTIVSFLCEKEWIVCIICLFLMALEIHIVDDMGLVVLVAMLTANNLQIPFAVARIHLSLTRLLYKMEYSENRLTVMKMFYIAVACQGFCYSIACIGNWLLSPLFRKSLAEKCQLKYKAGVECVDAFYMDLYKKYRKNGALDRNGWTLVTFAIECLESDSVSPHKKYIGVKILDSIMGQQPNNQEFLSIMNTSANALQALMKKIGSENQQYVHMRLLSSKVFLHIAGNVKVVMIPGTMQVVCSLLYAQIPDMEASSPINITTEETTVDRGVVCKFIGDMWAFIYDDLPEYKLSKEDSLPLLGIRILEKLAEDVQNYPEFNSTKGLISKIVEFTNSSDEMYSTCDLSVLIKLLSTIEDSELSHQVRQKILHELLSVNSLVEILMNDTPVVQKQLATRIIAELIDDNTIGDITTYISTPAICNTLIRLFLDRDLLIACEALSRISGISTPCMVVMSQSKYELLTRIFSSTHYLFNGGAKLIENLCLNNYLEYEEVGAVNVDKVLSTIMNANDESFQELEDVIALALQLFKLDRIAFTTEIESLRYSDTIAKKLVAALKNNKNKPSWKHPRIRRVIIEMAISLMSSAFYADAFARQRMKEVLIMVESTPSYKEDRVPGSVSMVEILSRAKELSDQGSNHGEIELA